MHSLPSRQQKWTHKTPAATAGFIEVRFVEAMADHLVKLERVSTVATTTQT